MLRLSSYSYPLRAGGCWVEACAGARFPPSLRQEWPLPGQAVLHGAMLVCKPGQWGRNPWIYEQWASCVQQGLSRW